MAAECDESVALRAGEVHLRGRDYKIGDKFGPSRGFCTVISSIARIPSLYFI